ncbi:MAG: TIGR04084 family radical SAM/SPASM domain-containing protein [Candidatus Heimdallarchaeota archaeon]|nr:TIGR04084 family radical SAM/SPASM domain-containing protein [Candidatus Heimdallarchaeota archaeon]
MFDDLEVDVATNYFIILTRACNLKCKYCGEDATFEPPPIDLVYPLTDLATFLAKDQSEITIQFYGGEPLLKIPLLEQIMDTISNVRHWSIQTNAVFLHKLRPPYLQRLSAILASIDGRPHVNDANRGQGNYQKVLNNCSYVLSHGFSGDLIARMTVSEVADIYEEVVHLASLKRPKFSHIHWQLDSQWDDRPENRWKDFSGWIDKSYNPGISRLVKWWLSFLREGIVQGLVPFIALMYSLLTNKPSALRCGAGLDSFAINPDGQISVCPISPEFSFSIVGHITSHSPEAIRNSLHVTAPCPSCAEYPVCGGRCLFINYTKLWGEKYYAKVCGTVKHLINSLRQITPEVRQLIADGVLSLDDFNYPQYNNGCEIIP